jgi:hypothetical protein
MEKQKNAAPPQGVEAAAVDFKVVNARRREKLPIFF